MVRRVRRPMRPNPLMPTRTAMMEGILSNKSSHALMRKGLEWRVGLYFANCAKKAINCVYSHTFLVSLILAFFIAGRQPAMIPNYGMKESTKCDWADRYSALFPNRISGLRS